MKVYWRYQCDYGHSWTLFRDENSVEQPEDIHCPEGHEAIILKKSRPIDRLEITFRPAGFTSDKITNKLWGEKRYRLILSDLENVETRTSRITYSWQEVIQLADRFKDIAAESAWNLWNTLEL
jgi:hypothetical protein